jgi:RND family efflux transporter MFP subunit
VINIDLGSINAFISLTPLDIGAKKRLSHTAMKHLIQSYKLPLITFIIMLGFSNCLYSSQSGGQSALATSKVKLTDTHDLLSVYAKVEAVHQATVSAQTSGRVIAINFDIGDRVKKGQTIILIRNRTQQSQHEQAVATFRRAKREYDRMRSIYKKRLISKSQFDQAEAAYRVAAANLKRASEELNRTEIKAPYSGIVVKRHVEVGETANVGQALITGLSLEQLRLKAEIPQTFLTQVRAHNLAYAQINGKRVELKKFAFSPFADANTNTFEIKTLLPKDNYNVFPGAFVKLSFVTGKTKKIMVPAKAIVHRSEVTAIYVVDAKGKVSLRQIRTGKHYADQQVEILSGLDVGDVIALEPIKAARARKQADKK